MVEPMSVVKLTALSIFDVDEKTMLPSIKSGASLVTLREDGRRLITMGNVPLDWRMDPPGGGLLLLYGFRDTLDELKKRRAEARQAGSDFHIAELSVEVGDIAAPLVNERTIKDLKFVNVKRMTAGLQSIILSEFSKYASQCGETEDLAKIQQIARRPNLFEPLLDESPLFKHLDLIIIPVADDPRRPSFIRQVGYIRNSAKITHIEQNTERNEFVLPEGMTLSD